MLCRDVIEILEAQSPPGYAMDWDNVGLLLGRSDREVKKLLIALDATSAVCDLAVAQGVDMIVTHHPIIFSRLDRINDETALGRKLICLLESGISCYAMHTNFDTYGGMGRLAASRLELEACEVLEETKEGYGIGEIGSLRVPLTLERLSRHVKQVFCVPGVVVYGDTGRLISRVAVCPGSGKSVIGEAAARGADCLVTGDIGHHEGIDAVDMGLTIIDASHYGIEKLFIDYMYDYLHEHCVGISLLKAEVGEPFVIL